MAGEYKEWMVTFNRAILESSVKDKKFAYIVTLGRAVNAILFIHSVDKDPTKDSPGIKRDRFNSYLFGSAVIFESLNLIECMISEFSGDEIFQNGLRAILNDETAKQIKKAHLKGARHQAVFHFDPKAFGDALKRTNFYDCPFVIARGESRQDLSYQLSDIVAAEILVGLPSNTEQFMPTLGNAMKRTSELVDKFIHHSELLIIHHLQRWGYIKMDCP